MMLPKGISTKCYRPMPGRSTHVTIPPDLRRSRDRLFVPYVCAPRLYHPRPKPFPICVSRLGTELAGLRMGRFHLLEQRNDPDLPGRGEKLADHASDRGPEYLCRGVRRLP